MSKNAMNEYYRTLCGVALLSRGVKPQAYKEALQKIVEEQPAKVAAP
jgi:hypothetical protein